MLLALCGRSAWVSSITAQQQHSLCRRTVHRRNLKQRQKLMGCQVRSILSPRNLYSRSPVLELALHNDLLPSLALRLYMITIVQRPSQPRQNFLTRSWRAWGRVQQTAPITSKLLLQCFRSCGVTRRRICRTFTSHFLHSCSAHQNISCTIRKNSPGEERMGWPRPSPTTAFRLELRVSDHENGCFHFLLVVVNLFSLIPSSFSICAYLLLPSLQMYWEFLIKISRLILCTGLTALLSISVKRESVKLPKKQKW